MACTQIWHTLRYGMHSDMACTYSTVCSELQGDALLLCTRCIAHACKYFAGLSRVGIHFKCLIWIFIAPQVRMCCCLYPHVASYCWKYHTYACFRLVSSRLLGATMSTITKQHVHLTLHLTQPALLIAMLHNKSKAELEQSCCSRRYVCKAHRWGVR